MTEVTDASTTGAVGATRYAPYSDAPSGDGWMDYHPHGEWVRLSDYQALRERAEAAEAERDRQYDENVHRIAMQARAENERDAARRAEAAAWEAGRDAAVKEAEEWDTFGPTVRAMRALTPPADLTAALTARLDAEWNAAIEAAGNLESIHGYSNAVPRHRIRALRRAAPTEGEA